jgi:hypothetical protein
VKKRREDREGEGVIYRELGRETVRAEEIGKGGRG